MAGLFQSFKSSSMPKRLLRYAVSRFDIFNPEDLDMENLDLEWGMKTILEFRDVGLRVKKLKTMLQLPPTLAIQKAKVLLLRVTLPMDIYSSPIQIEVEGVDVQLQVVSKEETDGRRRRQEKLSDDSDIVPTAADLAQSFLQQQPSAEKKQLQEALEAETQDLGASLAMSDSESDYDPGYGTGQGLSLPAFLTGFLRGIVDRTEIRIHAVNIQLDVRVPVEAESSSPELVTIQLALDGIDVEGVTVQPQGGDGTPTLPLKEGKRYICLDNIRASLITEANVFSTFAKSPSMPSSQASQSPVLPSRPPPMQGPMSPTRDRQEEYMTSSEELAQSQYALQDSEDAFNIPYDSFDDDVEEETEPIASSLSTPRASIYQDSTAQSQALPDQLSFAPSHRPEWDTDVEPGFHGHDVVDSGRGTSPDSMADSFHSGSGSSVYGRERTEDLTQSHLFSHEEAESMYQSAFSQTESVRLRNAMPGGWHSAEPSPETSPRSKRIHSTQPDQPEDVAIADAVAGTEPVTGQFDGSNGAESRQLDSITNDGAETPEVAEPDIQDGVSTPRGPARLVKQVFSLDSISVYVPSAHEHIQSAPTTSSGPPTSPTLPGAFSVYSTSMSSIQQAPVMESQSSIQPRDKSVEVILAPLEVRLDTSVGFLLATVISKLLEALSVQKGQKDHSSKKEEASDTASTSDLPEIKFIAKKISLLFLEKLVGVADTSDRVLDPRTTSFEQDILLQAILENFSLDLARSNSSTETSISLEKFRFGYADADIASFDQRVQLRASVRDIIPSAGADVSVNVVRSGDSTRCKINTLPLHVNIDLQRLDETFSWFGGLSSFINMGSSMTSSVSPAGKGSQKTKQKPRGVRFEAPISPDDKSATSENKVDLRIGGLRLDLVGKDCSVALETSAIKLVSREEGIGVGLSKIRLAGPSIRNSRGEAPVIAEISDTRLEYLMTPQDKDLERLLELITPSKVKFDVNDDVIMVDTLLRQRRKGPLLRLQLEEVNITAHNLAQLQCLPALGEELARLGTVAKYLPEDDRPGLLTMGCIKKFELSTDVGGRFGVIQSSLKNLDVAHITIPSLVALCIDSVAINRNRIEELVSSSTMPFNPASAIPVLMMRLIGDDIEPLINVKLHGLNLEYRVPTIIDMLDLAEDATPEDFEASLAASVANLGEQAHTAITGRNPQGSTVSGKTTSNDKKPTTLALAFRDCILGLNPLGLASKLDIVLIDADVELKLPKDDNVQATANLNKVSVLLIDDASSITSKGVAFVPGHVQRPSGGATDTVSPRQDLVKHLTARNFVEICQISSAKVAVKATTDNTGNKHIDVEIRDDLLVLETCADSTQTLIALANALKPPTPPSKEVKYKTSIMPVQDLMASIYNDAFGKSEGNYNIEDDFAIPEEPGGDDDLDYDDDTSPYVLADLESLGEDLVEEKLFDASSIISDPTEMRSAEGSAIGGSDDLNIRENYFKGGPSGEGPAHRWNSARNAYEKSADDVVIKSPFRIRVRDVHVIWNLYDGYDWQHTRDIITKTVQEVESKAYDRKTRGRRRSGLDQDFEEEETVIGDFLFNSIYIGIPANHDPRELTQAINQNIYGETTADTESVAATTITATSSRTTVPYRYKSKKLKLNRSRHHKITFELKGVNVDLITFPPGSGETQSSIDVRIRDLDIFDHIPTSTWKKFATYDRDAGEKPMGGSMVHLEVLNVRPVQDVSATDMVIKVTLLPLRLHVDQDALDFITRFFEFKDDTAPAHASDSDVPFIQRVEINSVPVQLDFKPKRVDYAGLRSGHTTEFMNFMILDGSKMTLQHTIVYGIRGFEVLGQTLNSLWMPDIRTHQLPGILAGLAPIRSLVNVGSGFKDLIEIPIREYKRDGRIVRSISKGAAAFAKSTGTELVKLGAKVATGTQYVLQGAEGMLVKSPDGQTDVSSGWDEEDMSDEERKQISLYADQPTGVVQGLRYAYSSLARDLNIARDAIIAVPAEVRESTSAKGAAKVVIKHAPTIIFRPAIGATKAIGQTLFGATNSLDPQNIRRMEDKYKSGPKRP